jgi:hypothetical protein
MDSRGAGHGAPSPKNHRTQPEGQARAGTEGLPELVIEVRTAKPLDKIGIFIHREECLSNVFIYGPPQ